MPATESQLKILTRIKRRFAAKAKLRIFGDVEESLGLAEDLRASNVAALLATTGLDEALHFEAEQSGELPSRDRLLLERARYRRILEYELLLGDLRLGIAVPRGNWWSCPVVETSSVANRDLFPSVTISSVNGVIRWAKPRGDFFFDTNAPVTAALFEAISSSNIGTREQLLLATLNSLGFLRPLSTGLPDLWEPEDARFHDFSRGYSTDAQVGATFRFGPNPPPAPTFSKLGKECFSLPLPDRTALPKNDFLDAVSARRSLRAHAPPGVSLRQLGTFLAVTYHQGLGGTGGRGYRQRPYPRAGGIYESGCYVAVAESPDVPLGLYRYEVDEHALYSVSTNATFIRRVQTEVGNSWGNPKNLPQVVLFITDRVELISWKYESLAYRFSLLGTGGVLQTMYLTCGYLGMAGCAIGHINPALIENEAGLHALGELPIAEFAMGNPLDRA